MVYIQNKMDSKNPTDATVLTSRNVLRDWGIFTPHFEYSTLVVVDIETYIMANTSNITAVGPSPLVNSL